MAPKTRDGLARRTDAGALDNLASAQDCLGRAAERLATLRAIGRSALAAGSGKAALGPQALALLKFQRAARELAKALDAERRARADFEATRREAEPGDPARRSPPESSADESEA